VDCVKLLLDRGADKNAKTFVRALRLALLMTGQGRGRQARPTSTLLPAPAHSVSP
jgi:hypothetical protein